MRAPRFATALLLLALAACGGGPEAKTPAPSAPAEAASAANDAGGIADEERVKVDVVAPGDGPKRALRYVFHTGRREVMAMDMKMTMQMTIGDRQTPPVALPLIRMKMSADPQRLEPNGDLVFRYSLDSCDVKADAGTAPEMIAALKAELQKLVGLAGEGEVTTRGETMRATMELPPALGEQMRDVLNQIRSAIRDLSAPLPEEPVGAGARWTATSMITMGDVRAKRTITYALKSLDGDRAKLDIEVAMSAGAQQLKGPRIPEGITAMLDSMDSHGSGKMDLDLQTLVPTSSIGLDGLVRSSMQAGARVQKMTMRMGIDVAIAPAAP
jgi:hypothetical protein